MKLVQFGAGNIGRGFIGALFAQGGYEVAFVDVNESIVQTLNERRSYVQCIVSPDGESDVAVKNVRAVDGRDIALVAAEIATADLLSTSVGVKALPYILDALIAGLRQRWAQGDRPIDLLICENLMDANHYLDGLIRAKLDPDEIARYEKNVGLVETSIGRMVPLMTPAMQKGDPLRVCVEPYAFLPVDADAFRAAPPDVPGLVPYTPFSFYLKRKLYIHNMGHAIVAYLGHYTKQARICDALALPEIALVAQRAMHESAIALSLSYGTPFAALADHVSDLLHRFRNAALGDTVERVGADVPRKLAPQDRLIGALRTVQGCGRDPGFIALGVAAALWRYAAECQADPSETLTKLCGIAPEEGIHGDILRYEALLANATPIADLIEVVERDMAGRRPPLV